MFDWFKKKPTEPQAVDRVWVDRAARDRALVRTAQKGPVLIIGFFDETVERVREALRKAGPPTSDDPEKTVVLAGKLGRIDPSLPLYLAERHPMPANNRALLERLKTESPNVVPTCFSALDEPFFLLFGGERIVAMTKTLGLPNDEAIEHPMVGKALANAREKLEKKVGTTLSTASARSMEAWLQQHVR